MLVTAMCAMLGAIAAWLSIRPVDPEVAR